MPRLLCIACRCEIERVEIARNRVVAVCVACEAYGDEAELVAGVRMSSAEPLPAPALPAGWRATVETAKRFNATEPEPVKRRASAGGSSRTR